MEKKIRILHIEERFHPAMGYQLYFFAKHHSPVFDFHILTSKSLSIWQTNPEVIERLDSIFESNNNVKIHRIESFLDRKNKRNLILKNMRKHVKNISPDIIFLHGVESFTSFIFFLRYSSYKNIKIVTDTHTLYNQFSNKLTSKLYIRLLQQVVIKKINKYNLLTFGTQAENAMILKNLYKIKPELIHIFPIGTDLKQYHYSINQRIAMREHFIIDEDTTVLIYAGKLDNNKKPHLIIDAIKLIEKQITNKLFLFFVGPKFTDYFNNYLKNTDFNNKLISIQFHEAVKSNELYKYYSMSDFAVLPTENSLSALDMFACKLPVIMQKDTTNAERIKADELLFEMNNIENLASKMLYLLQNKSKLTILGNEGYSYVKENFDYAKIVENLESILLTDM